MALDPTFVKLLACPQDKGPLWYFEADGLLYNPRLRLKYRVENDVPRLLVDAFLTADEAEHQALSARAPR